MRQYRISNVMCGSKHCGTYSDSSPTFRMVDGERRWKRY